MFIVHSHKLSFNNQIRPKITPYNKYISLNKFDVNALNGRSSVHRLNMANLQHDKNSLEHQAIINVN